MIKIARPIKKGLDYYPLNVDFLQDIKVRKIMRACGIQSITILISLLSSIYRDEGYYVVWDNDMSFLVADEVGASEGAVIEVVNKAVQVGFFNENIFKDYNVLTSRGIQLRFLEAVNRRKSIDIISEYLLIDLVNDCKNLDNVVINSINDNTSTQSKVKKSKVKKSKELLGGDCAFLSQENIGLIIKAWNQLNLQQLEAINQNTKRHELLKTRVKEYSLEKVIQAIGNVENSDFLKGQNDRGWTITFDWFVRPNNFLKVLEGNYDNKESKVINTNKKTEYLANKIRDLDYLVE